MRVIIDDVKQLKLKENLLWLGTTTLVTVLIWITYVVYAAYNTPQIDPEVSALLTPLNPSLDQELLSEIASTYVPPTDFQPVAGNGSPVQIAPPPAASGSASTPAPTTAPAPPLN